MSNFAGSRGNMRNGTIVISIVEANNMISGQYKAGLKADGAPALRTVHWYSDGRLTPAKETEFDLMPYVPKQIDNTAFDEDVFDSKYDDYGQHYNDDEFSDIF